MANDDDNHLLEALQSLSDFHEGQWQGRATSFAVTADVAAGVVQRKTSPNYKVSVQLGVDVERKDFTMTETMEWSDDSLGSDSSSVTHISSRKLSFANSNLDVDSVDASFSLDATLPDIPSAIIGTDTLAQFVMEHCLAVNDHERIKGLAFYGSNQSLLRIVICHERRIEPTSTNEQSQPPKNPQETGKTTLSAQDLIEMQGDVDRLVDKIAGRVESNQDAPSSSIDSVSNRLDKLQELSSSTDATTLKPHRMNLVELCSGVWLGDAVIRDVETSTKTGKGFGTTSRPSSKQQTFADWTMGVQKVAWQWQWNFGDAIRQVNDVGRSMGTSVAKALGQTIGGLVCVNEGLSRRIPKEQRMVYIDWDGDNVGFVLNSVYIQVILV